MKNSFLTLALGGILSFGIAGAALAQDSAPPPPQNQDQTQNQGAAARGHRRMDPDRQLQHLTRELGLSPDQQSQVKPVLVGRDQKLQSLFQDQSLSREDRRSRFQALRQDSQSKIEAVLNDQQKQQFDAMQQRQHGGRGGRGGRGGQDQGAPPASAPQPETAPQQQ